MDALPEDWSLLPKFTSDVCKWHLFFSNLTEDVFQVVNDTLILDYKRQLKFQALFDDSEAATVEPGAITFPESDEVF